MYRQLTVFRNVEKTEWRKVKTPNSESFIEPYSLFNEYLKLLGNNLLSITPLMNGNEVICVVQFQVQEQSSKESIEAFTQ